MGLIGLTAPWWKFSPLSSNFVFSFRGCLAPALPPAAH
jgi:hypothetical protein